MPEEVYFCPECKKRIFIPVELNESAQLELADFLRSSQSKIQTMGRLMHSFGMSLVDAKITVAHITHPKGTCANCKSKLLEEGITNCPACSGLNLNW